MAKVCLCLPNNHPGFDREFTLSLLSVVSSFYLWNAKIGNKHELIIIHQKDGWIDRMREVLAQTALDLKADYVLFCDTDMVFQSDLIEKMFLTFAKHKNIEAITGLYTWKSPPFLPHCYHKYDKKSDKFHVAGGFPLQEMFTVEGAGFGCLMFRAGILRKFTRPWFEFKYGIYGEDLYFFRKFYLENKRAVKMVCDPRLVCKHLTQISVDINSYIGQNKIKVEKDVLRPTPEQIQIISDFQAKLTKKFESGKKFDKKK